MASMIGSQAMAAGSICLRDVMQGRIVHVAALRSETMDG
jgi:hypothetical protein